MNRFSKRAARRPLFLAMAPLFASSFDDPAPNDQGGAGSDNAGAAAGGGGGSSGDAGGGGGGDAGGGKGGDAGAGSENQDPPGGGEGGGAGGDDAAGGDDKAGGDEGSGDDDPAGQIPETYSAPDMPEGLVFDEALASTLTPLLKEAKVTQAQFDKFAGAFAEHQMRAWEETRQSWVESSKKDPELNANDAVLKRAAVAAFGKFGSPAAREAMVSMGWGDHPEVLRVIGKLGLAAKVLEDGGTDSAASGGGERSLEARMYPGMPTKA